MAEKEPKRRGGCLKNILIAVLVLFLIGSCSALFSDDDEQAEQPRERQDIVQTEEETTDEEIEEEPEQDSAEPAEEEAEEPEEEISEDPDYQHEVIDSVDTYTFINNGSWSANSMMTRFSVDATRLLKDVHQDLTNGAVFRIATTLTDGYGNDRQAIVSTVWYSQETIEKINYDNWPRLDGEDLYNTADGVIVHFAIANDVEVENKSAGDNAPSFYRDSIGVEYE